MYFFLLFCVLEQFNIFFKIHFRQKGANKRGKKREGGEGKGRWENGVVYGGKEGRTEKKNVFTGRCKGYEGRPPKDRKGLME